MNTLSPELAFLVEYLDLPEAVGDPAATWETFQLKHLNNQSLLAIELKARQVGWSWLAAAESVASACLHPNIPHIFVSINQEEAGEKIRYAKQIIEALDRDVRPKLLTDNRYELEYPNGSRLISHPCRPPRGKARAKIYLDEFAHYPNDKEIYQAALPTLSKGGYMRIGSSPLGARGMFWEIYSESLKKYPGFVRGLIPWWQVRAMCRDVKNATQLAPAMSTDERVRAFGTKRLLEIYENMVVEDFMQEYECMWLDEAISWIDWDLIKLNQQLAVEDKLWYRQAKNVDSAMSAIDEIKQAVIDAHVEQSFVGGMDIGRSHDTTEIILTGVNEQLNTLPYRLGIQLDRTRFDDQQAVVEKLLHQLPVTSFLIDRNGIGAQLAENVAGRHPSAQGVDFTNASKALWAVEAKLRFQRGQIPIPLDRNLSYQIHSIKRKATDANNTYFENDKAADKHHADKFWALALALWAGKDMGTSTQISGSFANHRG